MNRSEHGDQEPGFFCVAMASSLSKALACACTNIAVIATQDSAVRCRSACLLSSLSSGGGRLRTVLTIGLAMLWTVLTIGLAMLWTVLTIGLATSGGGGFALSSDHLPPAAAAAVSATKHGSAAAAVSATQHATLIPAAAVSDLPPVPYTGAPSLPLLLALSGLQAQLALSLYVQRGKSMQPAGHEAQTAPASRGCESAPAPAATRSSHRAAPALSGRRAAPALSALSGLSLKYGDSGPSFALGCR